MKLPDGHREGKFQTGGKDETEHIQLIFTQRCD